MTELERHTYDVVVIGAGGAGLRAAIEAREQGKKTAIVCKSLFGKAHTVMAEGGIAAAMANVNAQDNWQVHFRDTMRGGKFLNNWRMAELHAKEAPERVWELETYGALFDRTRDGRISQRNFGGHQYPRLAHVGDRTGLELIRTLQQKIVSLQQEDFAEYGDYEARIRVFAECTVTELLSEPAASEGSSGPGVPEGSSGPGAPENSSGPGVPENSSGPGVPENSSGPGVPENTARVAGAFGYWRESGRFILFSAPAVILATGGIGKSFKVTSNSWEYTGDGHALALRAGGTLINMEFVQFHPTGMVWPPSVKGILVTESVRGDGGVLRNSEGNRFMFDYVPEVFRSQYAETEDEADRWYDDPDHNRRPPELLPRDEVARAINSEVKAGRGTLHGGVFLDIASRRSPEFILKRLPSMHHQFKELADVDITKEPMEIGPTCHYVMGGVEVDPDTAQSKVPGLFAAGEVAGGMHGSNRLGGNSLSDLLVFGKRAGSGAAAYVDALGPDRPAVVESDVDAAARAALAPFETEGGENPYTIHQELQRAMNDLVGIIRRADEVEQALKRLDDLRARAQRITVEGHRQYNPGWHLALDLRNMLAVSECVARAALERTESRGGHTRDDFPEMSADWRRVLLVCALAGDASGERVQVTRQDQIPMRDDLLALFDSSELKKYLTAEELSVAGSGGEQ
jgi:succinate dehydrogenase flavoprotein subunit